MKRKLIVILLVLTIALAMAACGAGKETTLSGMVVTVDGTKISLMEMDLNNMGNRNFAEGERPERPEGAEGFEGFQGFGGFNPEDFKGQMPDGETFPQWGEGEMPQMPEGMPKPESGEMPEDMPVPEKGEMPEFSGEKDGMRPGFGNFPSDVETKEVDIANAHISVENEGVKESGSMDDITPGTFVTVTMNGKGQATYVLVSSRSGFGGRRNAN